MKLRVLCLFFLFFGSGVLGSVNSAPYQTVLLWYAYRMDVIVNGPGNTLIAPVLKGTGPGGTFLFDEFAKYIQWISPRNKKTAWKGSTSAGEDLNPDVDRTVQELAGTGYTRQAKPSLVFPSKWEGNAAPPFGDFYGAITDRIQSLRAAKPDKIALQLDRLRQALQPIVDIRWEDQSAGFLEDLEDWFKGNTKLSFETKTVVGPDGTKSTVIDAEATIEKNSGATAELKKDLLSFIANYQVDNKSGSKHYLAIQESQKIQSRLMGDSSC